MFVEVKRHESVATLLLQKPAITNAIDRMVLEDLQQALSDVHTDGRIGAVVITGGGDHFCGGIDLAMMRRVADLPPDQSIGEWFAIWQHFNEVIVQILQLPKPVIAAVDGVAAGAGFAIALAADMIVASERATFAASAIARGMVGGSTATLLNFRVGAAAAARWTLTGDELDAATARYLGLCADVVMPDQIWVASQSLAERCAAAPREAVQGTKRLINERLGETLLSQLAIAAADTATSCSTDAAAEGIASFLEKRPPHWP